MAGGKVRIQRRCWILEYHPYRSELLVCPVFNLRSESCAVQLYLTTLARCQSSHQPCHGRLAATAFAHDAEGSSGSDFKIDVRDRSYRGPHPWTKEYIFALPLTEEPLQTFCCEYRLSGPMVVLISRLQLAPDFLVDVVPEEAT